MKRGETDKIIIKLVKKKQEYCAKNDQLVDQQPSCVIQGTLTADGGNKRSSSQCNGCRLVRTFWPNDGLNECKRQPFGKPLPLQPRNGQPEFHRAQLGDAQTNSVVPNRARLRLGGRVVGIGVKCAHGGPRRQYFPERGARR